MTVAEILNTLTAAYQVGFAFGLEKKALPTFETDLHQQAAAMGQRHALEAATFFETVMKASEQRPAPKENTP